MKGTVTLTETCQHGVTGSLGEELLRLLNGANPESFARSVVRRILKKHLALGRVPHNSDFAMHPLSASQNYWLRRTRPRRAVKISERTVVVPHVRTVSRIGRTGK